MEGASWKSARRRSPEQQAAQAAGRFEGRAGRLAEGASWKLAGRHSRKVDWRRKPTEGTKAKPKDAATDESEVRLEGRAGGLVEGASWKPEGRRSWTKSQEARAWRRIGRWAGGTAGDASRRLNRKAVLRAETKTQVDESARRLSGKAG